ncbi:MAG: RidA family protein [Alphaproteobacteria bacterium]|nr:RidA family protein [Alphaproteobacteria bacterium]
MVFVLGQIARHPEGHIVGLGDIRAKTRQVSANIAAVLALAGAMLTDVVKATTIVTDPRHLPGMWEIRR